MEPSSLAAGRGRRRLQVGALGAEVAGLWLMRKAERRGCLAGVRR